MKILKYSLRIIPALILFQTLFFKFTAAEESVYIFETLHLGALGRIGSGIVEFIIGIMLLYPKTTKWGSLGAMGVMAGAILAHIFILGIEVKSDGGFLFALAIITMVTSFFNFIFSQREN